MFPHKNLLLSELYYSFGILAYDALERNLQFVVIGTMKLKSMTLKIKLCGHHENKMPHYRA